MIYMYMINYIPDVTVCDYYMCVINSCLNRCILAIFEDNCDRIHHNKTPQTTKYQCKIILIVFPDITTHDMIHPIPVYG